MSYIPPCLHDLRALGEVLKKSYTGTNPDRLAFIALYDQLVEQIFKSKLSAEKIINVLVGALVFFLADIKHREYKGGSPKIGGGGLCSWFLSSGSSLYTVIRQKLQLTKKNKFGYDERLFYLNEFYKYASENYSDESINALKQHPRLKSNSVKLKPASLINKWETKEKFCEYIHNSLVPVLKRNSEDLNCLIHGVPVLNALLENLGNLENEYRAKSYNPTNPARQESINFIKFITQSCELKNPTDESWGAFSGAVILVLMDIEKEYKILPANRSTLFRECLRTINQESMEKITIDDKIEWLTSLHKLIIDLSKYDKIYNTMLSRVVENSANRKLDTEKLDIQIKEFQKRIEVYLAELNKKKNTPSNTINVIQAVTSYSFQLMAAPIALETTKNILIGGLGIGGLSAGGFLMGGPIGSAIFGAAGTLLMSSLGRLITQGVLTTVSAGLCAWMLGKIGDSVGSVTATVITYPFSATPEGLEEMRRKLKPMDDDAFVRMVNTMLEMETITDEQGKKYLTVEDKEHIRKLLGLKMDEKLKPLNTSIIQDAEEKKIRNAIMLEGHAARLFVDLSENSSIDDNEQLGSVDNSLACGKKP